MSTKTIVNYLMPNFEAEWSEAQKYFEFQQMGKKNWMHFVKVHGKRVKLCEVQDNIQNADIPKELDGIRKEMPLAVKFGEDNYEIVGGDARVRKMGGEIEELPIWLVDLSNLMFCI